MKLLKLGTVKFEALQYRVKAVVTDNLGEYGCSLGFHEHSNRSPEATHFTNGYESIIAFSPFPSPGTIAHECWHAVRTMLLNADAELDNETVAYHLGHLVDKISDMLHKNIDGMEDLPCTCPHCTEMVERTEPIVKKKKALPRE